VLTYFAICSLDGFIEDADGRFDWAAPSAEVHAFVNDLERPVGTYLYGRRMYETMRVWETLDDPAPEMQDFAQIWRAADKVVYSRTLPDVTTPRTRLERAFDADAVRELKERSEVGIGGAGLAAEALRAGVVDELGLLLVPVVVGRGKAVLPAGLRLPLELLDERRFESGVVYVRYRILQGAG
jgi:dihydrofolate reductase